MLRLERTKIVSFARCRFVSLKAIVALRPFWMERHRDVMGLDVVLLMVFIVVWNAMRNVELLHLVKCKP